MGWIVSNKDWTIRIDSGPVAGYYKAHTGNGQALASEGGASRFPPPTPPLVHCPQVAVRLIRQKEAGREKTDLVEIGVRHRGLFVVNRIDFTELCGL